MALLQKVQPGEPLRIPAGTFNSFVDAARDYQARQRSTSRDAQREARHPGIILIRNDSREDLNRFDILQISEPIILPTDNAIEFKNRMAMKGIAPEADGAGRFAILLEPLKYGAIGPACALGVCVVRVEMVDEEHIFADTAEARMDALISGEIGEAQLLWIQPPEQRDPPEIAWCVARIGSPAEQLGIRAVVVQKINVSGAHRLRCKRITGWPNVYDPNSPDLYADAGFATWFACGDRVVLIPVNRVTGDPEGQPAYFAVMNPPVDQLTLDEPNAPCLVFGQVPCPLPTPDPDPCLPGGGP